MQGSEDFSALRYPVPNSTAVLHRTIAILSTSFPEWRLTTPFVATDTSSRPDARGAGRPGSSDCLVQKNSTQDWRASFCSRSRGRSTGQRIGRNCTRGFLETLDAAQPCDFRTRSTLARASIDLVIRRYSMAIEIHGDGKGVRKFFLPDLLQMQGSACRQSSTTIVGFACEQNRHRRARRGELQLNCCQRR